MPVFSNGTYTIEYVIKDMEVLISGFKGNPSEVVIPESFLIDNAKASYRVTEVQKKAFLGVKGMKSISIPEGVRLVGDWAFSKCSHLREIRFFSNPSFGKSVFEGCDRLEKIYISTEGAEDDKLREDLAGLLAAAVNKFEGGYLLRDDDIGTSGWFNRWDLALKSYLLAEDIDGYDDRALCGEEDISTDGIASVDGELLGDSGDYLNEVGKNKCYLCILRMLHDSYLEANDREFLERYILARSYEKERAFAWKMLKEDAGEKLEFFEKYIEITNPDREVIEGMIKDISADNANIRAYLIKCSKKEDLPSEDFFSQLFL